MKGAGALVAVVAVVAAPLLALGLNLIFGVIEVVW